MNCEGASPNKHKQQIVRNSGERNYITQHSVLNLEVVVCLKLHTYKMICELNHLKKIKLHS